MTSPEDLYAFRALWRQYRACRRNKRNTRNPLAFEIDVEANLLKLRTSEATLPSLRLAVSSTLCTRCATRACPQRKYRSMKSLRLPRPATASSFIAAMSRSPPTPNPHGVVSGGSSSG